MINATYFSEECRAKAAALDIDRMTDAEALFAAFATADPKPASRTDDVQARDGDCDWGPVLLVNLFRLNGIEADLALAYAATGQVERVLVRVPKLGRHFDPARPPAEQRAADAAFRAFPSRAYVNARSVVMIGSAPQGSDAASNMRSTPVRVLTIRP